MKGERFWCFSPRAKKLRLRQSERGDQPTLQYEQLYEPNIHTSAELAGVAIGLADAPLLDLMIQLKSRDYLATSTSRNSGKLSGFHR